MELEKIHHAINAGLINYFLWPFSIAMFCLPEGILELRKKMWVEANRFFDRNTFLAKECIRKSYGKTKRRTCCVLRTSIPEVLVSSALQFRTVPNPEESQNCAEMAALRGRIWIESKQNQSIPEILHPSSSGVPWQSVVFLTIWIVGSSFFSMDRCKGKFTGKPPMILMGKIMENLWFSGFDFPNKNQSIDFSSVFHVFWSSLFPLE